MIMEDLAKILMKEAGYRYEAMIDAYENQRWSFVVRLSQECVELTLKAILRYFCIEPPKWHDVGAIFEQNQHKFTPLIREKLGDVIKISKELRKDRELSMYGDEERGLSSIDLYKEPQATEAKTWAEEIYKLGKEVIRT